MIDTLIKATILLAIVALAAHLLRRSSAALRHLLWSLAIVGLVALPVLTRTAPFELAILPQLDKPVAQAPQTRDARRETGAAATAANTTPPRSETQELVIGGAESSSEPVTQSVQWGRILLATWIVVIAFLLARFVVGFVVVSRIARRAVPITDESWHQLADRASRALDVTTPVDLRLTDAVSMPFACGVFNPVIVLPMSSSEWTTERRAAVLMHEFAHISRGDLAMNMLSHVVRAFYWFHPLAWLAAYRMRVEGERACDDAVLRAGALPSDYAEHLLSIVRTVGNSVPSVALAMARRSDFEGRLLAILEPGVQRARISRLRAAGLAAVFLGAVMPLAAMGPRPNQPAPAGEPTSSTLAPITAPAALKSPSAVRQVQAPPQQASAPAQSQGNGTAVAALIETLTDANASVRLAAASSLGSLGDPRAIAALSKALKEDTDPRVREAAAGALGEIDDARATPALIEALRTERVPNVKESIIDAMAEIDDPAAVSGIAAVARDANVNVRRAVARALGELGDPSSASVLIQMASDDDAEVRSHVADGLGELENRDGIETLMTLARDTDGEVRQQALSSLSSFEDQRSLPVFVRALTDPIAEVRQQAAEGISDLDVKSAPPALIAALSDENAEVRRSVAHALGSIGDEKAVPGLKRMTADTDTETRRAAAEALADIGGVEAIQALMGLLKDSDPEIRKVAAEALGKRRDD